MVILTIVITEDGPKFVSITAHLIQQEATPIETAVAEALNQTIVDTHPQPAQNGNKHH